LMRRFRRKRVNDRWMPRLELYRIQGGLNGFPQSGIFDQWDIEMMGSGKWACCFIG
jgi:hypothetical protein